MMKWFLVILGSLLTINAICWAGIGLNTMYEYGDAQKIVGGDAYNYIIIANRGIGQVCVGIVSAVVGIGFVLVGTLVTLKEEVLSKIKSNIQQQEPSQT